MKRKIFYFLITFIIISCKNNYELAEDYYKQGKFELAQTELKKIKGSESNNFEILQQKIDSSILLKAEKFFFDNKKEESKRLLKLIEPDSPIFERKNEFSKKIDSITDEFNYEKALFHFNKKDLKNSLTYIKKINKLSHLKFRKEQLIENIKEEEISVRNKKVLISKAVISSIFGRPVSIIKSKYNDSGYYDVEYRFKGAVYKYKVKFEGNKISWGAEFGRWRKDKIRYYEKNGFIYVKEEFNDGSNRMDKFSIKDLKE